MSSNYEYFLPKKQSYYSYQIKTETKLFTGSPKDIGNILESKIQTLFKSNKLERFFWLIYEDETQIVFEIVCALKKTKSILIKRFFEIGNTKIELFDLVKNKPPSFEVAVKKYLEIAIQNGYVYSMKDGFNKLQTIEQKIIEKNASKKSVQQRKSKRKSESTLSKIEEPSSAIDNSKHQTTHIHNSPISLTSIPDHIDQNTSLKTTNHSNNQITERKVINEQPSPIQLNVAPNISNDLIQPRKSNQILVNPTLQKDGSTTAHLHETENDGDTQTISYEEEDQFDRLKRINERRSKVENIGTYFKPKRSTEDLLKTKANPEQQLSEKTQVTSNDSSFEEIPIPPNRLISPIQKLFNEDLNTTTHSNTHSPQPLNISTTHSQTNYSSMPDNSTVSNPNTYIQQQHVINDTRHDDKIKENQLNSEEIKHVNTNPTSYQWNRSDLPVQYLEDFSREILNEKNINIIIFANNNIDVLRFLITQQLFPPDQQQICSDCFHITTSGNQVVRIVLDITGMNQSLWNNLISGESFEWNGETIPPISTLFLVDINQYDTLRQLITSIRCPVISFKDSNFFINSEQGELLSNLDLNHSSSSDSQSISSQTRNPENEDSFYNTSPIIPNRLPHDIWCSSSSSDNNNSTQLN
ncbi:hypothetical protein QTN25_003002 [Entamoeba marina]